MLFYIIEKNYLNKGFILLEDILSHNSPEPYSKYCYHFYSLHDKQVGTTDHNHRKLKHTNVGRLLMP